MPTVLHKTILHSLIKFMVIILLFAEKFSLYMYNPKSNVEIFRKIFAYSGADIWNYLPHDVKNVPSIKTFKFQHS